MYFNNKWPLPGIVLILNMLTEATWHFQNHYTDVVIVVQLLTISNRKSITEDFRIIV